jgi:hypothetical protein
LTAIDVSESQAIISKDFSAFCRQNDINYSAPLPQSSRDVSVDFNALKDEWLEQLVEKQQVWEETLIKEFEKKRGLLKYREFMAMFDKLGLGIFYKQVQELVLREVDADGDGDITLDSFIAYCKQQKILITDKKIHWNRIDIREQRHEN